MHKRTLLSMLAAVPLAACGFRLRGMPTFAFSSVYLQVPRGSVLGRELQRVLESSSDKLRVLTAPANPNDAEVIFQLLEDRQERVIVGLNSAGQVREVQLRLRVRFKLRTPNGDEPIPDTELLQFRDVSYNEALALSKEAEEAMLFRDMRSDVVQQLLRRLSAVRDLTVPVEDDQKK
jgi:LPS-assembly lipoprotein